MKLLLDMYRSAPKEQRDKVQLMAAEKKYNSEVSALLNHVRHTDIFPHEVMCTETASYAYLLSLGNLLFLPC